MQKDGVNKFIFLFLTFMFLIGVVSAWSVSITNPADSSYYGYQPDLFGWSFSGINQGDLKSTFKINLNNNLYTGVTSSPVGVIEQSDLLEGWNNLKINVTDNANHSEYSETNFWVDSISPLLAVLNPLGIGYTNTNTLNLLAQLTETNPGYYFGTKEILRKFTYPNSGTPNHIREYDLDASNIADASHSLLPGDQEEGKYSYIIYAKDIYPNSSTIREITEEGTIIRDTLSPTTFITSPLTGLFYSGIVNIVSSADDDVSVTTDVSGVNNITINITSGIYSQKFSSDSSPLNYGWDSTTGIGDGNYNIEVTSYDRAGNSDLETITITIDNTAPTIADNYGFNGTWINSLFMPQLVTLNPIDLGSGINNTKYCEGVGCAPNVLLNSPYQLKVIETF